jgi:hypothetical protein
MSNIVIQNQISLLPEQQEFETMKSIASMAFKSGLLPSGIKSAEAAMIIMLKGRELGIPAMQAFSHIHIINGKPTMSAELMLTQIYKCIPKAVINFITSDDQKCEIESQRPNGNKTRWSFTIIDAKKAELLSKDPWKKYTSAMLRARAITIMARAIFPDCLNGVSYTAEELGADIDLDDQGNEIIKAENQKDVTPKVVNEVPPKVDISKISKVITKEEANNINGVEKYESHIISIKKNEAPISMSEGKRINELIEVKKILTADIKSTVEQLFGLQDHKLMKIWQAEVIIEILAKSANRDEFGKNVMLYQESQSNNVKKQGE